MKSPTESTKKKEKKTPLVPAAQGQEYNLEIINLQPYSKERPQVTRNGCYYTSKYKSWRREADKQLKLQWGENPPLQFVQTISIEFGGGTRRPDLEGLFGSVADALQRTGVIRDDNLMVIQRIETNWVFDKDGYAKIKLIV